MSTHRYKRSTAPSELTRFVVGATLVAESSVFEDIALADDTNKPDLDVFMASQGFAFVSTAPTNTPNAATGTALSFTETADIIPRPEGSVGGGNSTRVCQTTFEGTAFILDRRCTLSRVTGRVTAVSSPGTIRIGIYQAANGGSGVANLIAQVTGFAPAATGNFAVVANGGAFTLERGVFFVLFGRESASGGVTLRSFMVDTVDGQNSNMDADLHCTTFSTTLSAAAAFPATFDPRPTPTGAATPSTADVTPVFRLKA